MVYNCHATVCINYIATSWCVRPRIRTNDGAVTIASALGQEAACVYTQDTTRATSNRCKQRATHMLQTRDTRNLFDADNERASTLPALLHTIMSTVNPPHDALVVTLKNLQHLSAAPLYVTGHPDPMQYLKTNINSILFAHYLTRLSALSSCQR